MSKKKIDFSQINETALAQLKSFSSAMIAKAHEDERHRAERKALNARLEAIHENREINIKAGMSRDEVLIKFSTLEIDNALRAEDELHKKLMEPINLELNSAYSFIPEKLYEGYKRKIKLQKRGEYVDQIKIFLGNLGVLEISQSALCKLAEQIADYIGVTVSTSRKILADKVFSCVLQRKQFNKLFMSVFCDILVINGVMECCFE